MKKYLKSLNMSLFWPNQKSTNFQHFFKRGGQIWPCAIMALNIGNHFLFYLNFLNFLFYYFIIAFLRTFVAKSLKLQQLSGKFTFIQQFSQFCMWYLNALSQIVIDLFNFYQIYKKKFFKMPRICHVKCRRNEKFPMR